MTSTLIAIGWSIAGVMVVCYLLAATRNARNQLSYAAPLPLRPSSRFLLRISPEHQQDDTSGNQVWGAGLTKSEAEDLLDWLEAHGRSGKLSFVSGQGFTVR